MNAWQGGYKSRYPLDTPLLKVTELKWAGQTGASDVTYHSVTWHVARGDTERRVLVVLVSVDGQLPAVNAAAREPDRAKHDSLVEAAARRRQVVVGEQYVVVGGRRIQTEPRHCMDTRSTHSLFSENVQ